MPYSFSPQNGMRDNFLSLTFSDVSLIPQYSTIKSREEVDLSVDFLGFKLKIPLVSANMSTVTEPTMVQAISRAGGAGILHRYAKSDTIIDWITFLKRNGIHPIIPSIGIKPHDIDDAARYQAAGADIICIDVAHGDCERMVETVRTLVGMGMKVIAGNICTYDAVRRLITAGAHAIKIGVGPGSACSTRTVTGHGVPQLTSLMECEAARNLMFQGKRGPKTLIISDGGVSTTGDCVKALAFGANLVMSGYLFSGCPETPGEVIDEGNVKFKRYIGMASKEARDSFGGTSSNYMPEGVGRNVKVTESVSTLLPQLAWGIKSGLSYSGARDLQEFRDKCRYVMVTNNGEKEGQPWGLSK